MQEELDKSYDKYLEETIKLIFNIKEDPLDTSNKKEEKKYPDSYSNLVAGQTYNITGYQIQMRNNYDLVFNFHNGYAHVVKNGKWNFIDTNGREVSNTFFRGVHNFKEGMALVSRYCPKDNVNYDDVQYNFINEEGKLISDKWYERAEDFSCGYACVAEGPISNLKYTFIDKEGKPINNEKYSDAKSFDNGFALVRDNRKGNFINTKGRLKFDWFLEVKMPDEYGYRVVKRMDTKDYYFIYNLVDSRGNLISNDWFFKLEYTGEVYEMKYHGKRNIFDPKQHKFLSKEWYDDIRLKDGFVIVQENSRLGLIDKDGYLFNNEFYDHISSSGDYCILIPDTKGIIIVDKDGKSIVNSEYKALNFNFQYKFGVISRGDGKLNYIDLTGKVLCDDLFDVAEMPEKNYGIVGKRQLGVTKWNVIDRNGNYVFENWQSRKPNIVHDSSDYSHECVKITCGSKDTYRSITPRDYGKYKIKNNLVGYTCVSQDDSFNVKYRPDKIYGTRYVICHDNKSFYLYDRIENKYYPKWAYDERLFGKYFGKYFVSDGLCYLMYDNKMIDISKYVNKYNLKEKDIIEGYTLLSKDDYFSKNEEEIRELAKNAKLEFQRNQKKLRESKEEEKLRELAEKNEETKDKLMELQKESMSNLRSIVSKLESYEKRSGKVERMKVENLFINHGEYKEFNPVYLEEIGLKHIDLSGIPLKDVKVSGIDFSETNISFGASDPQDVYNRDMSNCNFEGINFLVGTIFSGTNIKGSKFTTDKIKSTLDINIEAFKGAIFDENTTLDGIPLTEYDELKIRSK